MKRSKRSISLALAVASAALLAGCASSSSASVKATPTTETFTSGKITGPKVLESTVSLTYSGVVPATGSFYLGGAGPKKGQINTFATSKGNLVLVVASDTVSSKFVNTKTCLARNLTAVNYTVDGSKATGSFKDASGSGVVTATFQSNSELKGQCSLANNAEPVTTTGAYATFTGTGPMKAPNA